MIANSVNFFIEALVITASAISVGISQGLTSQTAFKAIDMQPQAKDQIRNLALLSSALIETAAIVSVFIAVLLFLENTPPVNMLYSSLAKTGIAIAIIGSGFVIGIVSSWPAQAACISTARQPFEAQRIFTFTLLVLSIIQTPLIFAFIVALFIKSQALVVATFADSLRLLGAGIAIGIGCIGPALGLAYFSQTACKGLGFNRNAAAKILTFTFISQAIIESPIIFALITSLLLLLTSASNEVAGIAMLAAGIASGLGTFGPGLSSGRTAMAACEQIIVKPDLYTAIARTSIFAQGIIDTAAIYVLLASLMMVFIVR